MNTAYQRIVITSVIFFGTAAAVSAGEILSTRGDVTLRAAGETEFSPATPGDAVARGATLRTGSRSNASLSLLPRTSVTLADNTSAVVERLTRNSATLRAEAGTVLVDLPRRSGLDVAVATPLGVARAAGTTFAVVVEEGRELVHAGAGAVSLEVDGRTLTLTPGQIAVTVTDAEGETTTWVIPDVPLREIPEPYRGFVMENTRVVLAAAEEAVRDGVLSAATFAALREQAESAGIPVDPLPDEAIMPPQVEPAPDIPGEDVQVISPS